MRILKKAAAMNVSHFIVTADHGFLYQHEELTESDFLPMPTSPGALQCQRRFIVAPAIPEDPSFRRFTAAELGLSGSVEIAIPKSLQRLRLQGSGSRYVHGGASLQEIGIPVLEVKKERASDIGRVEVDIVRTGQQITTDQVMSAHAQDRQRGGLQDRLDAEAVGFCRSQPSLEPQAADALPQMRKAAICLHSIVKTATLYP